MLRQDCNRIDPKRRSVIDHRRKQFATAQYKEPEYKHRLNFYTEPPTADITLEQFEQWAIDRLRVLAELEACSFRNKSPAETASHMKPVLERYLPLDANSSSSTAHLRTAQRQKDHYSHFILRLAFSSTEDLRRRFARVETALFRMRFVGDDLADRAGFVAGLDFDWWHPVTEEERREFAAELAAVAAAGGGAGRKNGGGEEDGWFRVDWDRVPDLVEGRRVFVRQGQAFVPVREQASMVVAEFGTRLEKQLVLTARALPRLDEDDRLTPILNHLSKNFITPDAAYMSSSTHPSGATISATTIDTLVTGGHFPACMTHLHRSLRRDAHLRHFGRLQYGLFLKGIGLSLEEALVFWRTAFSKITDDVFNKEYRYNVRHAYGDVGGDANRRSGGAAPYGCQKILTEHAPGPASDAHGCPYRHFGWENLRPFLEEGLGVRDGGVLQGVREDKENLKYHMACNRVFEYLHKQEIKRAKDEGVLTANQLETIVHPNEYFKRSFLLKNLDKERGEKSEGG